MVLQLSMRVKVACLHGSEPNSHAAEASAHQHVMQLGDCPQPPVVLESSPEVLRDSCQLSRSKLPPMQIPMTSILRQGNTQFDSSSAG